MPKGNTSAEGDTLQSFCSTLQVPDMSSVAPSQLTQFWQIPRHRTLIPCPRHVSSRLPPSGETCKYATPPCTQKNLERFSTYWYAHFCCVCLGCCAAEFGSSGGTYELPCSLCLEGYSASVVFWKHVSAVRWLLDHSLFILAGSNLVFSCPYCLFYANFWARSRNLKKRLLASSCLSVCPSAWNNPAPSGRIFLRFIEVFFESVPKKFQVSLKSEKINWYFSWRPV
jgi:hypothetical protein